ncbi:hypothetical protein M9Y10_027778 [Tritrichomonas musculus]|uniref:Uncharacterized protein n=2 Tax=Tritrichomonas musculus TaxID=1915356 RepID=A0ABR2H4U7_9EUKA
MNNEASEGQGGAICFKGIFGNIEECQFINNKGSISSEIYYESGGSTSTDQQILLIQSNEFHRTNDDNDKYLIHIERAKTTQLTFKDNKININNNDKETYLLNIFGTTGTLEFTSNCIKPNKESICESSILTENIENGFTDTCEITDPDLPNHPTDPIITNTPTVEPTVEPTTETTNDLSEMEPSKSEQSIEYTEINTQTPTINYSFVEITVDTPFIITTDTIEFNKDGFKADDKVFSINNNTNDIVLISSQGDSKTIKLNTTDEIPEKPLFVSPHTKGTEVVILPPNNEAENYGHGEFGVHANSNINKIILPKEDVPLNIFNDEISEFSLEIDKTTTEKTVTFNQLIMSNGLIQMNAPKEIDSIHFKAVETFKIERIETKRNNEVIETKIDELKMNSGSQLTLVNSNFNTLIKSAAGSRLNIEQKATFNEKSVIEFSLSSLIEFGSSKVEGVCNKIKLIDVNSTNRLQDDTESVIPMICGSNFDCDAWKDRFYGNEEYQTALCLKTHDSVCLSARNTPIKDREANEKSLSTGAIAGIVIVIIVVIVAVVLFVIYLNKHRKSSSDIGIIDFEDYSNDYSEGAAM